MTNDQRRQDARGGQAVSETPKKGLRFQHSRVVNWDDHKTPALYEVTKVARGMVYYAPVYDAGIARSERLGRRECCTLEYFPKVILTVHKYAGWPGKAVCGAVGETTSIANSDVNCQGCKQ